MADSEYTPADFNPVVLVDRAGTGGFEFMHGGRVWQFKKGQTELPTVETVALFILRTNQTKGWTKDGQHVNRIGVKDPSPRVVKLVGAEGCETTPIELSNRWPFPEQGYPEGWDRPDRLDLLYVSQFGRTKVAPVTVPASDFRERQGSNYAPARERG